MGSWSCHAQSARVAPLHTAVTPAGTGGSLPGASGQTPADTCSEGRSCEGQHVQSQEQPRRQGGREGEREGGRQGGREGGRQTVRKYTLKRLQPSSRITGNSRWEHHCRGSHTCPPLRVSQMNFSSCSLETSFPSCSCSLVTHTSTSWLAGGGRRDEGREGKASQVSPHLARAGVRPDHSWPQQRRGRGQRGHCPPDGRCGR